MIRPDVKLPGCQRRVKFIGHLHRLPYTKRARAKKGGPIHLPGGMPGKTKTHSANVHLSKEQHANFIDLKLTFGLFIYIFVFCHSTH